MNHAIFQEAKSGGKHKGTYKQLAGQTDSQLLKSVQSFEENVIEHTNKINNPSDYAQDWQIRNEQYKLGIVKKWLRDIARNEELTAVVLGVIEERGLHYEYKTTTE